MGIGQRDGRTVKNGAAVSILTIRHRAWYARVMVEIRDGADFKIANMQIGEFMVLVGDPPMSDEEHRKAFEDLNAAKVPGFQDWMREVPRRGYN